MCGIVVYLDYQSKTSDPKTLTHRMTRSLDHRGPDAYGVVSSGPAHLGHTRLSIIGIESGHQPMTCLQTRRVLVFNGEIYNHHELRTTLKSKGYRFSTSSDTEVLLHGFDYYGEQLVDHLIGMFAFAIWDPTKLSLFVARDRLGIKPLYVSQLSADEWIIASELKAMHHHPRFDRTMDQQAILDYFTLGYVPDPKSIYQSTSKCPPGHHATLCKGLGHFKSTAYWDVPAASGEVTDMESAQQSVHEMIRTCVESRLESEVPLGAFLSGGVDSSAVVSTMAALSESPVRTLAIGFEHKAYDESSYAEQVAAHCATDHTTYIIGNHDLSAWPNLMSVYDEPFADSSAIPTLKVCENAAKYVKVALSGDGGDEVFAGYRRYKGHMLEQKMRNTLPPWAIKHLIGPLAKWYPALKAGPRPLRAKATLTMLSFDAISGYVENISIVKSPLRKALFTNAFRASLADYETSHLFYEYANARPHDDDLSLVQYLDMKTYLPGDILTKVDRASMHHSLEVRVPLLDHRLIALAQTIAPSLKLLQGESKAVLKSSFSHDLPNEILYRNKKGFAVPLNQWFKQSLADKAHELTKSERLLDTGIFNQAAIGQIVDEHMSGRHCHAHVLWSLCMFDDFLKQCVETTKGFDYARAACA